MAAATALSIRPRAFSFVNFSFSVASFSATSLAKHIRSTGLPPCRNSPSRITRFSSHTGAAMLAKPCRKVATVMSSRCNAVVTAVEFHRSMATS